MPLDTLIDPDQTRHRHPRRLRTAPGRPGPRPDRQQPRPEVVAAPVHRPHRPTDRRRPDPPPVRRLAGPADLTARPDLPRPVLRRPDPRVRPHHPLLRRRSDHLRQRPRRLQTRQPGPRNARLASDVDSLRATHRTPHRSGDHPHRTLLPEPSPRPTLNHEGLIPNRSVRNRNASANG